jgi:hypothetical protein
MFCSFRLFLFCVCIVVLVKSDTNNDAIRLYIKSLINICNIFCNNIVSTELLVLGTYYPKLENFLLQNSKKHFHYLIKMAMEL